MVYPAISELRTLKHVKCSVFSVETGNHGTIWVNYCLQVAHNLRHFRLSLVQEEEMEGEEREG